MNQDRDEIKLTSLGQIEIDTKVTNTPPSLDDLPILPTRNLVLFPGVTLPIQLGRHQSIYTAEQALEKGVKVGILCQKQPEIEVPTLKNDMYKYGVTATVLTVFKQPNGHKAAIVMANERFRVIGDGEQRQFEMPYMSASIKLLPDLKPSARTIDEFDQLVENLRQTYDVVAKNMSDEEFNPVDALNNSDNPELFINALCTHFVSDTKAKIDLLKIDRLYSRGMSLLSELMTIRDKQKLSRKIYEKARRTLEENQRNAFLQQQMDSIREELYGDDQDEIDELARRAAKTSFPDSVRKVFNKEIEKLRRLNPSTPDYSVQYSYLETLLDLPWEAPKRQEMELSTAEKVLNDDHYGLEKVKERILEQLAMMMYNPEGKSPIICLVGPPGVGKTSLGRSIARALGRQYQRVSLGGLHDEAEIRGHRRTYIGAMPGRIVEAMKRAGTVNPVLLLDEVDKIGQDYKGDPAAALLEVLDPEQNCHFHDNYVDVDYDLSKVMFIVTANTLSTVAQPLIDRMEVIDLSGYILEEKVEIALRHIWPRLCKEHNVQLPDMLNAEVVTAIIENYTSESGVRQLEKRLATVLRKYVLAYMSGKEFATPLTVDRLKEVLGTPIYNKERYESNKFPGVVTGLAWTQVGGEILLVESALTPGKGDKLTLTGNLGDVMKESANIAMQWVKAHGSKYGIADEEFEKKNVHIHFPEGAIPKDGPSAGITIVTSLVSVLTGRLVRERIAMTGEITLRGKVLPVGGIKEKILAAKRAGITDIVMSKENTKDIDDIPEKYLSGLTFHYVDTIDEVLDKALL